MQRRRFLKTTGGGLVLLGSGLIGVPVNACRSDRIVRGPAGFGSGDTHTLNSSEIDLDALQEMTPGEVEEFLAEVDQAAQDRVDLAEIPERPRVPPNQRVFDSLPTLGANPHPTTPQEWSFTVTGEVSNPLEFDWAQFASLDPVDLRCDIHCVTGWTMLDTQWNGVRLSHLLELARLTERARYVIFDCEHGYTTNISIQEALKPNVIIATGLFSSPLPLEHGGLARGLVPDLYLYKSGKWVRGIRILQQDEPGYWETRGYSNTADPWTEDRYG